MVRLRPCYGPFTCYARTRDRRCRPWRYARRSLSQNGVDRVDDRSTTPIREATARGLYGRGPPVWAYLCVWSRLTREFGRLQAFVEVESSSSSSGRQPTRPLRSLGSSARHRSRTLLSPRVPAVRPPHRGGFARPPSAGLSTGVSYVMYLISLYRIREGGASSRLTALAVERALRPGNDGWVGLGGLTSHLGDLSTLPRLRHRLPDYSARLRRRKAVGDRRAAGTDGE